MVSSTARFVDDLTYIRDQRINKTGCAGMEQAEMFSILILTLCRGESKTDRLLLGEKRLEKVSR